MMAQEHRTIPLRLFWRKHLLLPTALFVALLLTASTLLASYKVNESRRKSLSVALDTLSLIVAEPMITGDELEVIRRVGPVANALGLRLLLTRADGSILLRYPVGTVTLDGGSDSMEHSISRGGRVLGSLRGQRTDSFHGMDTFAALLGLGCLVISLGSLWMLTAIRKIVDEVDLLTRAGLNNQPPAAFQFTEFEKAFLEKRAQADALVKLTQERARWEIAAQVAHDIRSPLAALDLVISGLSGLQEDKRRIVRAATSRIKDISNNLLASNRSGAPHDSMLERTSIQLLPAIIEEIVSEKRLQYRSQLAVQIEARLDSNCYGLFSRIQSAEFKRVISNLVNNAIEALDNAGTVTIHMQARSEHVEILIEDNGRGISEEILPRLMQQGATFGKANGTGLGLYHAKSTLKAWEGEIFIASTLGKGTTVTLRLPRARTPDWFTATLVVEQGTTLVVLDDDSSIHQIWTERFQPLSSHGVPVELVHFSKSADLIAWQRFAQLKDLKCIYLMDFELLGEPTNGLSIIEQLGIWDRSTLVTSRFDEESVRAQASNLKVRIIPKGMAPFVPIKIKEGKDRPSCILVDDDDLVHLTWKTSAKDQGKAIVWFRDGSTFLADMARFDRTTPIFIDVQLGNGLAGDQVALLAHEAGFSEIYLATGFDAANFSGLPWLRGIVGKEPPEVLSRA